MASLLSLPLTTPCYPYHSFCSPDIAADRLEYPEPRYGLGPSFREITHLRVGARARVPGVWFWPFTFRLRVWDLGYLRCTWLCDGLRDFTFQFVRAYCPSSQTSGITWCTCITSGSSGSTGLERAKTKTSGQVLIGRAEEAPCTTRRLPDPVPTLS